MNALLRAVLLIGCALWLSSPAAAQSTVETGKAMGNEVARETKKVVHRAGEAKSAVVDGAQELKDRVDSDGK